MKTHDELELSRHGVTPSQFAAYVRRMLKNHGIDYVDIDFPYWQAGNDIEFDYHDDATKPAAAEKSISRPYAMQSYIRDWYGNVYNLIMEFDFFDDKTGFGYFYLLNDYDDDRYHEPTETSTETSTKPQDQQEATETSTKPQDQQEATETSTKPQEEKKGE